MKRLLFALVMVLAICSVAVAQDTRDCVSVIGEGRATLDKDAAASEEEAIWDAKRNAVEQAAGLLVKSRTLGHNFQIESDEIRGQAGGFVKTWEVVQGSRHIESVGNGRVLCLQVRASVALLPVIHRLSDISDVYKDMERPRLRVEIVGDTLAQDVQNSLVTFLRKEGFDIVESGPAEVILSGRLELLNTLKLGDKDSPYGVGELAGAYRARMTARLVSEASEDTLLTVQLEESGASFHSEDEARNRAASQIAKTLITQNDSLFVRQLLARWTEEREDGYVAALKVSGLDEPRIDRLRELIHDFRGYQGSVSEVTQGNLWTLRFRTRLDMASLRRRLAELSLKGVSLRVQNKRGPTIECIAKR